MAEKTMTARRIKELRAERGWTQEQLAGRMGHLGASPLAHWEAGLKHPRRASIEKLAQAFEVEPEELTGVGVEEV